MNTELVEQNLAIKYTNSVIWDFLVPCNGSYCRCQKNKRAPIDFEVMQQMEKSCSSDWCFCTGGSTTSTRAKGQRASVQGGWCLSCSRQPFSRARWWAGFSAAFISFSAAVSVQQSRELCGSRGNTLHICKRSSGLSSQHASASWKMEVLVESLCLYQVEEEEVSWIGRACSLLVKKAQKHLLSIYVAAGHLRNWLQKKTFEELWNCEIWFE